MSNTIDITAPLGPGAAKQLFDEFAVAEAVELALSGNYASAESLLTPLIQRSDVPAEALALLAKICVQQGRVLEAEGLWRRALEKDPSNSTYQAALVRLNRMQQRPVWLAFLWPAVLALAVIVVCQGALQIQSSRHRAELARLEKQIDQASETAAKTGDVGRLSESVNDLKTQQAELEGEIKEARRELLELQSTTASAAKTSRKLLAAWLRRNSRTPRR